MCHAYITELNTGILWLYMKERERLEDLGLDGRIILKRTLRKNVSPWTGLIWFRIRARRRLL
jgi:hypothetical protein